MRFLLNFSRRQKVLFTILFIFLILVFYLVSKELNEKKVSVIKEEKTFKNKQNETKQEKNEIVDNKDIVKEVIKPELNEKKKKVLIKQKKKRLLKKSIDENLKKNN